MQSCDEHCICVQIPTAVHPMSAHVPCPHAPQSVSVSLIKYSHDDYRRIHSVVTKHWLLPGLCWRIAELSLCQSFFGAKKLFFFLCFVDRPAQCNRLSGSKKCVCACVHESLHILVNLLFYFLLYSFPSSFFQLMSQCIYFDSSFGSHDVSVGIMNRLRAGWPRNGASIPDIGKPLIHIVQTALGGPYNLLFND